MSNESERVRGLAVAAVEDAADLLARPSVEQRWSEPSALDGMTVGGLAAHLVRAAGATLAYLDRTDPTATPTDSVLSPVTYFHAALDAPIHTRIKEVSADESSIGAPAMAAKCRRVADELRARLATESPDRLVGALGGRMISLDDFCRTRLIEVLTHIDDLVVSAGEEWPELDPESMTIVFEVLLGIARAEHGDRAVLHAFSRAERQTGPPVFPVF